MSGRVVHFEVPFDDGERARSFYQDVFGWKLNEMPEMSYTIAMTGPVSDSGMSSEPGYINGGMYSRESGYPASPVITVDVASIDETLTRIEHEGGSTVLAKQAVGDMGFAAYFKDSEGNVLGLWETATQG
ncbi:MAG TPA: VOC family protein [Nocardioidaceae bacterium]|nr:VOC family protein [Nocardioidaceae bacterium]